MSVAALFVDPRGVYSTLPGVDCWGEERDARLYRGPHPVVAHPPCNLWVNFAAQNFQRYKTEHNRPAWKGGDDGGCFASALHSVRQFGGVLEHPMSSHAFKHFRLARPYRPSVGWQDAGALRFPGGHQWVCEVWQSAYGHPARKCTWLFYVGQNPPFDLNWSREPGTHQVGWFDRNKPTLGKRAASATPPAFAEELVMLARHAVS